MAITDLWTEATYDAESDIAERRLTAARTAALPLWPFLAAAATPEEYVHRKALIADKLDRIASAVCKDEPANFAVLRFEVEATLDADYDLIDRKRVIARQRAEQEVNARRMAARNAAREQAKLAKAAGLDATFASIPVVAFEQPYAEEEITRHDDPMRRAHMRYVNDHPIIGGVAPEHHTPQHYIDAEMAVQQKRATSLVEAELGDGGPPDAYNRNRSNFTGWDMNGPPPYAKPRSKNPVPGVEEEEETRRAASLRAHAAMPNVDDIIAWENGDMDSDQEVKFFQGLVDSGMAWRLQGMYGRRAQDLIDAGLVHKTSSLRTQAEFPPKKDDSAGGGSSDGNPFAKKDSDPATDADSGKKGGSIDPTTMQPGTAVTLNYTLTGGVGGSGAVPATFDSTDGQTYYFTYDRGRFGVTQQGSKWVDSAGTEFTFDAGTDPNAQPAQQPIDSATQAAGQPPAQASRRPFDNSKVGFGVADSDHPEDPNPRPPEHHSGGGGMGIPDVGKLLGGGGEAAGAEELAPLLLAAAFNRTAVLDEARKLRILALAVQRYGANATAAKAKLDDPKFGMDDSQSDDLLAKALATYLGVDIHNQRQAEGSLQTEAVAWGRRHYEDLASAISAHPEREQIADHFAHALKGTNPAYREEQFRSAASSPGYRVRGGTGTANYSRGHYQRIADAVKTYHGDRAGLAEHLANHFAATSGNFDHDRFIKATAGLQTEAEGGTHYREHIIGGDMAHRVYLHPVDQGKWKVHHWSGDEIGHIERVGPSNKAGRFHGEVKGGGDAGTHSSQNAAIEALYDAHLRKKFGSLQTQAAPSDGEQSYCRICGIKMEGQDYAWYALSASSPQRQTPPHHHIPARGPGANAPGEYNSEGKLNPGTPEGGFIYDNGAHPIPITAMQTQANPYGAGSNPYLPGGQTVQDAAPAPGMDRSQSQPDASSDVPQPGQPQTTRPRQRPSDPNMGGYGPMDQSMVSPPPTATPDPTANQGFSTASLVPVVCEACHSHNFVRVASLTTAAGPACPTCGSDAIDLDDDFEATAAKLAGDGLSSDRPMGDLHDTDAVKQGVTCSNCLHSFTVTATDPAQPLPACPNCGSTVVSAAGGTNVRVAFPGYHCPQCGHRIGRNGDPNLESKIQEHLTESCPARNEHRYEGLDVDSRLHSGMFAQAELEPGDHTDTPDGPGVVIERADTNQGGGAWGESYVVRTPSGERSYPAHDLSAVSEYPYAKAASHATVPMTPEQEARRKAQPRPDLDEDMPHAIDRLMRGEWHVSQKVNQIVEGIRAANPGLTHDAALKLAVRTIERFPKMVEAATSR